MSNDVKSKLFPKVQILNFALTETVISDPVKNKLKSKSVTFSDKRLRFSVIFKTSGLVAMVPVVLLACVLMWELTGYTLFSCI